MKLKLTLSIILLLACLGLRAQLPEFAPHRPATLVQNAERASQNFQAPSLFEMNGTEATISSDPVLRRALRKGTLLNLRKPAMRTFNQNPAENIRLQIPTHDGTFTLKLVEVNIIDKNLPVRTSSQGNVQVNYGHHYQGVVEGHTNSLVAISIFDSQISGFFASDEINGNYVVGKLMDENTEDHIVYHDGDLLEPVSFGCFTEHTGEAYTPSQLLPRPPQEDAGDCVLVYCELDYNVYTANGSSLQATTDYLVGLFNQSVTLYANESIAMGISEIFIWTSVTPYSGSAESIRDDWQANNNSMNGDLGHYLYWQSSGGSGIAAGTDNSLCGSVDGKICVTKTSLNFETVPTYSRAVKVFTHEMGHLLGSRHTHACVWNGNGTQIDDYGNTNPPTGGAAVEDAEGDACFTNPGIINATPTIMSYFDSYGWGDLPLGNGFGQQPGDVIRNSVASANCLVQCCDAPVANCQNITRSLGAVSGTVSIISLSVDDGSTYDCGLLSLVVSETDFDCDDVGGNSVTLTVTDIYYRTSQCNATVTIQDNTNPTALCDNITVFLDANGNVSFTGADIDDGSFDACGILSREANPNSFQCPTIGAQTSTLTVTDNNGNTASCEANVFVDDTNAKPDDLEPQNCGNCDQIRMWYCQFDPAPVSLNEFINGSWQMNAGYVPGNGLYWYNDAGGSQGAPFAGNGSEPPIPNMNLATNTYWYWVAQIDQQSGCIGDAIRVRVRVRKTPVLTFSNPPLPFCLNGQVDLAEWVEDANNVTDQYDFYDADPDLPGANLLGSVSATNGVVDPLNYVVETPVVGNNTYWCVAINEGNNNSITCTAKASMTIPVASPSTLAFISNKTVDHGDNVTVPFLSPNATHIIWVDHYSFNNPNIGLVGNIGLGNLSFTAQNNSLVPITAMIRVISYKNNCAGQYRDFFITVNPSPARQGPTNSLLVSAFKLNVHDVRINWDIVYDGNLKHFEVEKLKEGVAYSEEVSMLANADNWEKIATVDYANNQESYTHIDREGMSNVTKYRLKLVHEDGRIVWSEVVEIRFDFYDGDRFVVFPNPSNGQFQLKSIVPMTGQWNFQISDALGRTIKSGIISANEQTFDLNEQTPGVYFLVLRNKEGMRYVKRVVRN